MSARSLILTHSFQSTGRAKNCSNVGGQHSHLLAYKLQPAVYCALGLGLFLLQEHGPDEFVDGLIVLKLREFLLGRLDE